MKELEIRDIKWIAKSKITKMTTRNKFYPMIRLGDDPTIVGKTAQVYRAKINGRDAFLVIEGEEELDGLKQKVELKGYDLSNSEIKEDISEIKKAIEKLTELITENRPEINPNSEKEWARGDLNSRPLPRQGNVITS